MEVRVEDTTTVSFMGGRAFYSGRCSASHKTPTSTLPSSDRITKGEKTGRMPTWSLGKRAMNTATQQPGRIDETNTPQSMCSCKSNSAGWVDVVIMRASPTAWLLLPAHTVGTRDTPPTSRWTDDVSN